MRTVSGGLHCIEGGVVASICGERAGQSCHSYNTCSRPILPSPSVCSWIGHICVCCLCQCMTPRRNSALWRQMHGHGRELLLRTASLSGEAGDSRWYNIDINSGRSASQGRALPLQAILAHVIRGMILSADYYNLQPVEYSQKYARVPSTLLSTLVLCKHRGLVLVHVRHEDVSGTWQHINYCALSPSPKLSADLLNPFWRWTAGKRDERSQQQRRAPLPPHRQTPPNHSKSIIFHIVLPPQKKAKHLPGQALSSQLYIAA